MLWPLCRAVAWCDAAARSEAPKLKLALRGSDGLVSLDARSPAACRPGLLSPELLSPPPTSCRVRVAARCRKLSDAAGSPRYLSSRLPRWFAGFRGLPPAGSLGVSVDDRSGVFFASPDLVRVVTTWRRVPGEVASSAARGCRPSSSAEVFSQPLRLCAQR